MKRTRADVAERFRWQAGWCGKLGSPLYQDLLDHAAADVERGGPVWDVLAGDTYDGDGLLPGAQALRLMGAVHRMVLEGRAPELAAFYPSAGGAVGEGARDAFIGLLAQQRDDVAALVGHPVQTNEPGRSAGLMGGFLEVARQTGLPLRLLEIGASAGLNLRWDRYFYAAPAGTWGDASIARPVRPGLRRRRAAAARAAAGRRAPRAATPIRSMPPTATTGSRCSRTSGPTRSSGSPQLRGAFDVAAAVPVAIDRVAAVDWLEQVLADRHDGVATVVFHSVVLPYLGEQGIADLKRTIEDAGARATGDAPLAWMSMEAGTEQADVRLTTWPSGESRVLARATFHGPPVRWLED